MTKDKPDMVNHPPHYTFSEIEPIDVIENWELGFHLGAALKYIARHKHKGGVEDLRKALWFLERIREYMRADMTKLIKPAEVNKAWELTGPLSKCIRRMFTTKPTSAAEHLRQAIKEMEDDLEAQQNPGS